MAGLYAEADAMVFPTFFGPTNIPVLEAWAFGCPVVTSDIRGIREQVNDAAILVDPRSVEDIADGIYRLWTDESLRLTLAGKGKRQLSTYTPEDYRQRLTGILNEAVERVKNGTIPGPPVSQPLL
jgi:glycosyltransferase involved in cell wall biosynthesis